ncbi:LysR family transcriptional regulator [Caproiciproducens sp. NJN-50]|uniref:LysR family transcriptional regulator n=1 Tax=Acutalibacteraceae TaxID=3082771 RepID=UPI000FFE2BE0|nr:MULTISPECIES: LysR family transcriptional regulator [Acutalibacteraceae]QAT48365.1 LysR family transcriptional regulator [Caproiciproducens sp. NJN-50]
MEFRFLHSFLRIAELESFTKAADELGYAQSTVTMQIQQLEREVGFPLFERIGKRVILTPYGQQMKAYAKEILKIEAQIQNLGNDDTRLLRGTLRIGIVESIINSLLLNIIKEYCARFPKVSVKIIPAVTAQLVDLLRHNEVDIIMTMGENTGAGDCVCAASHQENAVFFSSPGHPLANGRSVALEAVFDYPMILTGENTFLQQELNRIAARCHKNIIYSIQTGSSQIIANLVQQGLGISFLPEYLLQSPFLQSNLSILPVKDFSLPFYVHVFYHKNKWVTPQMRGLVALIQEYWNKHDNANSEPFKS